MGWFFKSKPKPPPELMLSSDGELLAFALSIRYRPTFFFSFDGPYIRADTLEHKGLANSRRFAIQDGGSRSICVVELPITRSALRTLVRQRLIDLETDRIDRDLSFGEREKE